MKTQSLIPLLLLAMVSGCASPDERLIQAIKNDDVAGVRDAVARGADLKGVNELGQTPLIKAVHYGYKMEVVEALIQEGADVNYAPPTSSSAGIAPLHEALRGGNLPMVKVLLRRGANPNLVSQGKTPLMLAQNRNAVELLVKAGANPNLVVPGSASVMNVQGPVERRDEVWMALRKAGGKPRRLQPTPTPSAKEQSDEVLRGILQEQAIIEGRA